MLSHIRIERRFFSEKVVWVVVIILTHCILRRINETGVKVLAKNKDKINPFSLTVIDSCFSLMEACF